MSNYKSFLKVLFELSDFVLKLPPVKVVIVVIVSGLFLMTMLNPSWAVKILSMDKLNITLTVCSGFGLMCGIVNLLRYGYGQFIKWRNRIAESRAQAESCEQLKDILLSLPLKASYILRYLYMLSSHKAYIPVDNVAAESLYREGLLKSRCKAVRRGHGYSYECDCYYYELSDAVLLYLSEHIEELGVAWGYDSQAPKFGRYQRAGKVVVLEHS